MLFKNSLLSRQLWLLIFAWVIIGLDQFLKNFLINILVPGEPVPLLGELVQLNLAYNDSAAFSIGFGATWIFTIISSLAALTLLWYSFKLETLGWAIMAGVFLGGVCGNLIDRLIREPGFGVGHVVDYIQIPLNFPIFNIADMAIFTICTLYVVRILRGETIGCKASSK